MRKLLPLLALLSVSAWGQVSPQYSANQYLGTLGTAGAAQGITMAGDCTQSAGNITCTTLGGNNVPQVLLQTGIPFVVSSSGTMANNGALSAVVAMPRTIGNSYAYFPANTICTSNAAGFYWTEWGSTTAATVYNNVYAGGQPEVVASPTAFSCTAGTFTQTTTQVQSVSVTVPAGSMGVNGALEGIMLIEPVNNGNTKYTVWKLGGSQLGAFGVSAVAAAGGCFWITNQGLATAQISPPSTSCSANLGGALNTGSVNTANAQTLQINMQIGTASTDYLILDSVSLKLVPHN
nr:hypothetical protein [uncultured Rhodopila sp.]